MKIYSFPRPARERGQELVEFALIFLPLFMTLMGILDLGRVVYCYTVLYNAVREGARYAIIDSSDINAIKDIVTSRALGLNLDASDVTVELQDNYTTVPGNDTVQIHATYDFTIVTPIIGAFFGGSNQIPLATQASMKLEK
jgi:Flp pilus assembly protein TadG